MRKLTKRIATMGAAVMMMGTMSVIGAGAVYSGTINIHYVSSAPSSDNKTSNSWTYYTSTPTQIMRLKSFSRSNDSAYVRLYNPMGINSSVTSATTSTKTNVKTGVKITASATLYSYGSGSYYASGSISG